MSLTLVHQLRSSVDPSNWLHVCFHRSIPNQSFPQLLSLLLPLRLDAHRRRRRASRDWPLHHNFFYSTHRCTHNCCFVRKYGRFDATNQQKIESFSTKIRHCEHHHEEYETSRRRATNDLRLFDLHVRNWIESKWIRKLLWNDFTESEA